MYLCLGAMGASYVIPKRAIKVSLGACGGHSPANVDLLADETSSGLVGV